jgi:hypothetical protein
MPTSGWTPDPSWPPAPPDWRWWLLDDKELHRSGWSRPVGRALVLANVALVAVSALLVIASLIPQVAVLVANGFLIPFGLIFPIYGATILYAMFGDSVWPTPRLQFRRPELAVVRARVPSPFYHGALVVFAAQAVSFAAAMATLRHGGPGAVDGVWYAQSHGSRIAVTYDEYVRLVQAQLRLFSGGALTFAWIGMVLALASPLPPGPIPATRSSRWRR